MLRDQIIEKINNLGGLDEFLKNVENIRYRFPKESRNLIDNIRIYYKMLFRKDMDHEYHVMRFMNLRLQTLDILNELTEECNCNFCKWFIEFIEFGNDYVGKLRRLA